MTLCGGHIRNRVRMCEMSTCSRDDVQRIHAVVDPRHIHRTWTLATIGGATQIFAVGINRIRFEADVACHEDSVLPSGGFGGIVEVAMDCTEALCLNDISAWRLRRLDVSRLRGSHLPVRPTGEMAADTAGQPGIRVRHQGVRTFLGPN